MTAQASKSPVFTMMPEHDHQDIILVAIMDMMFQHLKQKNRCNEKRMYQLNRIHTSLLDYEKRYEGAIPDYVGDKADDLNRIINKGLDMMCKPPKVVTRNAKGRFEAVTA
jgi:hypothetical protein